LSQENINHLNRPITCNESEAAIKSLPKKENSESDRFSTKFYQTFKEELIPTLLILFHEIERKEQCQTHSMKSTLHASQNHTRTKQKREL
jgi:hypothetical protein